MKRQGGGAEEVRCPPQTKETRPTRRPQKQGLGRRMGMHDPPLYLPPKHQQ